ncbi:cell wall-binding repeat-containing protein [Leifsonia sp. NPDC102414]|uniref:cell wall-binding repeat-containing protein n=1 Tax=Leifsonia sp. NPDC102414 TaxID=3364124 RepID=UPI00380AE2BA
MTLFGMIAAGATAIALLSAPVAANADTADDQKAARYYAQVQAAAAGTETSQEAEQQNVVDGIGEFQTAGAADAVPSKFVAGDLASDAVFYKGNAWSAATIQSFLNTKGSGCTTAAAPGCLKNFKQTTPTKVADPMCAAYTGAAGETAATIIAKVGVACGINPVALLTIIQKEQGLVSTTAPTQWMYDHATGWNCPDTAIGCSTSASSTGFFNQVYGAAWQFKRYANPAGTSNYFTWIPVGKVKAVQYNLDASCGTKQVAIFNKATAALYYYTPYTPNDASLASYPGEGDGCSAYGIRNFWMLFNAWYGSSTAGSVPAMARLSGSDRFETSAAISRAAYPTPGAGVASAYIASGMNFPDALAAAPAAAKLGGPLLLVQTTAVPSPIMTELRRLKPKTIYVAGGVASVTNGVLAQLRTVTPTVKRVADYDRFATARAIANQAFGSGVDTAYVTSGMNFPDALSAGGAAGAQGKPVLLVNGALGAPDSLTVAELRSLKVTKVNVVGGPASVSAGFANGLQKAGFAVTRLAGSDRFATSVAVNAAAFPGATSTALLASGAAFPDALSGAAYAATAKSPLQVTPQGCVYPRAAVQTLRAPTYKLLGGTTALSDLVGKLSVCQ